MRWNINDVVLKHPAQGTASELLSGASVTVKDTAGNNLVVYTTETGSGTTPNPVTSDADGRFSGWVTQPDYDLTIAGTGITTRSQAVRRTTVLANETFTVKAAADTQPRISLSPAAAPAINFGVGGSTATDIIFRRNTSGLAVTVPASRSAGATGGTWRGLSITRSGAEDFDGSTGGSNHRVYLETNVSNASNGTRGDAIGDGGANSGGHSSMSGFYCWGSGTSAYDEKGSLHHYTSVMTISPYHGGGDVYCEGLNFYGEMYMNRKGAFSANFELLTTVGAGSAGKTCGGRFIMSESNALAAYASGVVPTQWQRTGARIIDIQAVGTQRSGTGIAFVGGAGYEWFIQCENTAGTRVSGIDGNGGVFTRSLSAAPTDADFRQPVNGLIAIDGSTGRLYYRTANQWRWILGT